MKEGYQYVLENVIKIGHDFGAIFLEKTMGYSLGYFLEIGSFLKMAVT